MEITLPDGQRAVFDDADDEIVWHYRWHAHPVKGGTTYVSATDTLPDNKRITVFMHRLILGAKHGQWVDHRNGNGLDNRRENIRLCTPSQNCQFRRRPSDAKNAFKGVTELAPYRDGNKRWQALIRVNGKNKYLGVYLTAEEAGEAYKRAALQHFGEFAKLF